MINDFIYENALIGKNILISKKGWGYAIIEEILSVIISSAKLFKENISEVNLNKKMIYVAHCRFHETQLYSPHFVISADNNYIFLLTENHYWCQYAYQFTHEYCHHLIESNFVYNIDKFGWFEEAICELASLHSLIQMSADWKEHPAVPERFDYAPEFEIYANKIISKYEDQIVQPVNELIKHNIYELSNNRYLRYLTGLIAVSLFPLFKEKPALWDCVTYIGKIKVTNELTFSEFIENWGLLIHENQQNIFKELKSLLI